MKKEIATIMNREGKISEDEMELLKETLPYIDEYDAGASSCYTARRMRYRFYLHEVRGCCVIATNYIPYVFEEWLDVEEYLNKIDEKEAYKLNFYNYDMTKEYSTFLELQSDFFNKKGLDDMDLMLNPEISGILNRSYGLKTEDYKLLYQHLSYIQESPEEETYKGVIWLNSSEYCCINMYPALQGGYGDNIPYWGLYEDGVEIYKYGVLQKRIYENKADYDKAHAI